MSSDNVDSAKTNKRLGIKVPRSTLLPPYLALNDYYVDYTNSIDVVFGKLVDEKIDIISNLRNMWVQNHTTEVTAQANMIITSDQWSIPEREIVVKQVNMLGMKLQNAGVVTDDAYQQIARFVGMYWFGKGTEAFINFINYCLQSQLTVATMWTQDYKLFLEEGNTGIGTPIWEGGTWYPTTHVTIVANNGLQGQDIRTITSFFYEIANYNLVLESIDQSFDMKVVTNLTTQIADIVAIGLYTQNNIAIANSVGTGAPSPVVHTLPNHALPTTYCAMGGVQLNLSNAILLAQPSGWFRLPGGQIVPVYGASARQIVDVGDLGVQLMGPPVSGQFNLLYGPVTWLQIPNSPNSQSRIPSFGYNTYTVEDGIGLPTQTYGEQRDYLLVNPTGFIQLAPGQYSPYW